MVPEEWPIDAPLAEDGAYAARPAGRYRLSTVRRDFFLDPKHRLSEQERAVMTAMLADLLGNIAIEIGAAMPSGSAPANDDDDQHLLRELSSAGLLDHEELIALLLRRADEERIATAVRARSGAGGAFLQALIADDDEGVSAAAMALILARGRRRDRLGQPRIEFEDLSEEVARSLAQAVAAALRRRSRGAVQDDADLLHSEAASLLLDRRDTAKAAEGLTRALVEFLNAANGLDEQLLEAAAREGDMGFLSHALAERAGIPVAAAWDHLVSGERGRLVLLLRMADVSRSFGASLLALLGDLVGLSDLGTEIGRFDELDAADVSAARDWLRLDPAYRTAAALLDRDHG